MERSGQSARWEDTEFFFLDILHLEHREKNPVQDVQQAVWHVVLEFGDSGCLDLHYVEAMEVDKLTERVAIMRQGKLSPRPLLQRATKKRRQRAAPRDHPHLVCERNSKYSAVGCPSSVSVKCL